MICMNTEKRKNRIGDGDIDEIKKDITNLDDKIAENTEFRLKISTAIAIFLWLISFVLAVIAIVK